MGARRVLRLFGGFVDGLVPPPALGADLLEVLPLPGHGLLGARLGLARGDRLSERGGRGPGLRCFGFALLHKAPPSSEEAAETVPVLGQTLRETANLAPGAVVYWAAMTTE